MNRNTPDDDISAMLDELGDADESSGESDIDGRCSLSLLTASAPRNQALPFGLPDFSTRWATGTASSQVKLHEDDRAIQDASTPYRIRTIEENLEINRYGAANATLNTKDYIDNLTRVTHQNRAERQIGRDPGHCPLRVPFVGSNRPVQKFRSARGVDLGVGSAAAPRARLTDNPVMDFHGPLAPVELPRQQRQTKEERATYISSDEDTPRVRTPSASAEYTSANKQLYQLNSRMAMDLQDIKPAPTESRPLVRAPTSTITSALTIGHVACNSLQNRSSQYTHPTGAVPQCRSSVSSPDHAIAARVLPCLADTGPNFTALTAGKHEESVDHSSGAAKVAGFAPALVEPPKVAQIRRQFESPAVRGPGNVSTIPMSPGPHDQANCSLPQTVVKVSELVDDQKARARQAVPPELLNGGLRKIHPETVISGLKSFIFSDRAELRRLYRNSNSLVHTSILQDYAIWRLWKNSTNRGLLGDLPLSEDVCMRCDYFHWIPESVMHQRMGSHCRSSLNPEKGGSLEPESLLSTSEAEALFSFTQHVGIAADESLVAIYNQWTNWRLSVELDYWKSCSLCPAVVCPDCKDFHFAGDHEYSQPCTPCRKCQVYHWASGPRASACTELTDPHGLSARFSGHSNSHGIASKSAPGGASLHPEYPARFRSHAELDRDRALARQQHGAVIPLQIASYADNFCNESSVAAGRFPVKSAISEVESEDDAPLASLVRQDMHHKSPRPAHIEINTQESNVHVHKRKHSQLADSSRPGKLVQPKSTDGARRDLKSSQKLPSSKTKKRKVPPPLWSLHAKPPKVKSRPEPAEYPTNFTTHRQRDLTEIQGRIDSLFETPEPPDTRLKSKPIPETRTQPQLTAVPIRETTQSVAAIPLAPPRARKSRWDVSSAPRTNVPAKPAELLSSIPDSIPVPIREDSVSPDHDDQRPTSGVPVSPVLANSTTLQPVPDAAAASQSEELDQLYAQQRKDHEKIRKLSKKMQRIMDRQQIALARSQETSDRIRELMKPG